MCTNKKKLNLNNEYLTNNCSIANDETKILSKNRFENIWLAPMAGITNSVFRKIANRYGARLTTTEMISAKGIYYNNDKTKAYLKDNLTRPFIIQIFGHEPDVISEIVKELPENVDFIEVNMGCPAPKIVKNGDGSAIMKNITLAMQIIYKLRVTTEIPIGAKIRKGFDETNDTLEFAKNLEKAGCQLITIHGRTRNQFYSGKADWAVIKKLKDHLKIPIIGNGDIVDEEGALEMFKNTNCDGIMIGRAARGNPFIFKRIVHYLKTGNKLEPTQQLEILNVFKEHLLENCKLYEEKRAIIDARKHFFWYIKGMKINNEIKEQINKMLTLKDAEKNP